ncbi:TIGR02679 domain-containing protein [Streptomyces sp. W16]|uniref:TIGR02679 domain-containing protein n=1 Tax=Streptomyces sp. W16 TaxID=3076631 RepID=UPI00295A5D1D|nr:TIGR02679 domain-containing protein [Streptomyces sp. W16]MDV9169021.1 TIGR02679 domain-containing protein [Streptomyces sp. W16]
MPELPAGLAAWARLAGPAMVLDAIRSRAEQGFNTEDGTLRVTLTASQRREVARLVGTQWDVSGRPVRLKDVAAALGEHGLTVREFVETLVGGPLVSLRQLRAEKRTAADAERSAADALLAEAGIDAEVAREWLDDLGTPRAGDDELRALTEQTVRVWNRLPGAGRPAMRLAQLAATVLDNAHALDHKEPLGRAVSRLIAYAHGVPRPLRPGRDWRRAWKTMGVRCDGVSSRVLVLNLPLYGDAPAARWSTAAPGEPLWLSLRSLTGTWSVPPATRVFVCENPSVLEAAADELGPDCPPLICTDGMPSNAALDLVAGLAAATDEITVRADIDDAGFVVVDQLLTAAPAATTWRYDTGTYLGHLGMTITGDQSLGLDTLRDLYEEHRIPIHEEALLTTLLDDLSHPRSR